MKRAPDPFDASLCLGTRSGNGSYLEFLQQSSELGGIGFSPQLLSARDSVACRPFENEVAVAIDSPGAPTAQHHLLEQQEVALSIFLFTKHGVGHLPGGVVNAANERQVGASPFEPIVPAAIDLE